MTYNKWSKVIIEEVGITDINSVIITRLISRTGKMLENSKTDFSI
jgi:hypothetical protein